MMGGNFGLHEVLVALFVLGFAIGVVGAWWNIFSKAGHSGALTLTMPVPVAGFFVFLWFAFSEWPIERRLKGNG